MANRRGLGPSISFFAFQDIITAVVGIFILITLILALELAQRVEAASTGESVNISPIVEAIETLEAEVDRLRKSAESRLDSQSKTVAVNKFTRDGKVAELKNQRDLAETRLNQLQSQINRLEAQKEKAKTEGEQLAAASVELETQRSEIQQLAESMRQLQSRINQLAGDEAPVYRDETDDGRFVTSVTFDGTRIELRDALTQVSRTLTGAKRLDELKQWISASAMNRRQLFIQVEPGGSPDFNAARSFLEDERIVYGFTVIAAGDRVKLGFEVHNSL